MSTIQQHSALWLVGRSLLPSAMSALFCGCFALFFVILQLLFLSLNIGTSLPGFFNGQWATLYTNSIVQPLEALVNNLAFNDILTVLIWGVIGLVVYFFLEYAVRLVKNWREAQKDVQFSGTQLIPHHSEGTFIAITIWRFSILVIAFALFVALQPLIQHTLAQNPHLVLGDIPLKTSIHRLALALVGWGLLSHIAVVLIRLFLMRTRIFGDDVIE